MTDLNPDVKAIRVSIMQPYLFPYIGYFQLIDQSDIFVQYDDVNYIKKGWINRNQILVNGQPHRFVLPVRNVSQNKKILELEVSDVPTNLLRTFHRAYSKAPEFASVYPLIETILTNKTRNLADYLDDSIQALTEFMGITTRILRSSQLPDSFTRCDREQRLVQITHSLGGNIYLNAPGARELGLYSPEVFLSAGIKLMYLAPGKVEYRQMSPKFQPNLSIVDVLMFNPVDKVREHLNNFALVY